MNVYVGGTFDLFHPGHVNLLRQAAAFGDVTVALNRDGFAARYKRPPIMSLDERRDVVGACRYVSRLIVNEGDEDSTGAILAAAPDLLVHGDDWTGRSLERQMGVTGRFLTENAITTLYLPYTKGVSTSDLIGRCQASGS